MPRTSRGRSSSWTAACPSASDCRDAGWIDREPAGPARRGSSDAFLEAIRAGDLARVGRASGSGSRARPRRAGESTPALVACYHRQPAVLGSAPRPRRGPGRVRGRGRGGRHPSRRAARVRPAGSSPRTPGTGGPHFISRPTSARRPRSSLLLARGADPRARSRNALANTPLHAGLAGTAGLDIVGRPAGRRAPR